MDRTGADLEQRELFDGRELSEEAREALVGPDQSTVRIVREHRESVQRLRSTRWRVSLGEVRKRSEDGRREGGFEICVGETRKAVLEGDRFSLFGQPEPPRGMPGRRREDRGVRWAAASARAPPATVEDRELDAVTACARGELLLGAVDLPLRGQVAPVLAGVGVPDHHLQSVVTRDTRVFEQLVDDRSCAAQILDRLEERYRLDPIVARVEDRENVCRAARPRHDHSPGGIRAVAATHLGNRVEGGACRRAAGFVGVEAEIEPSEVETKDLDPAPELSQLAVGDPRSPVGTQATIDQVEICRQLVR